MALEGMRLIVSRWVKPQCDGLIVLVSSVECVLQVHEESIAVPAQVVLDERVREVSLVE
jgi:hypothetical protein